MDAWNIYHKDGSVLCDVDGNQVMFTSLENTDVWMGECSVSITVKNNSPVIFSIGDYVIYRNERYEINYDPGKIKASSKNTYGEGFVYNDIKFNSLSDELVRAEFLDVVLFEGTVNVDGIETPLHYTALPKFSFYVEFIDDLLDRIQANMNEQYGDGVWKIFSTNLERSVVRGCSESEWHNAYGNESKYIAIDSQSITVDNSTCWDALSLVNSKWDITFIVRGRNVYVGINGPKTPHVFKYGKGNGLREIEQTVDSDQNVITRLRAYGSDKNMPQRYYAELGKKCFANVTKVDKSVSNSIEITTDLPYNSTLFNTPRTYKTSEDSETFTLGWALKVTFDFQTVVTAHIEPTTTQDGYCIVHTELGEPYDTGDELDSVKLQKFIESASVGKKLYFTRGIYKSAFEKEFIEFDNNMPNNMAVNRLMLPGFPDTSLSAFWNTMTDEEKKYVNPTGSNIIFSEDKYRPYLDSPEKENAGLRQYSMYFDNDDKKNGIIEIYPTIEEMVVSGERIDEISVGSSINDDGVFDDGQEVRDFYIKLKKQIDFDLNDVKNDDFSISLKDGMCGGRTFKINACTKESDGSWSLKCARVKDDALELWFPYKDYPIRNGDHFVLTGLELPDSYIRAASIKLLKYSISYLNSNCKTRYAFQLKVDDLFMARQHDLSVSDSSGATKSLYKTLRAGDVMSIRDEDLGIDSDIVIEQLTIKEEEGNIPSYEITLRDDKSVGAITKIQDKIDSIYSAVGTGVTLNESQVESVVAKVAGKLFVTNDWFGRIFNIVDQYGNKQGENEGIAENSSIRAKMSLWSDGGISALGNSASSGGSGGGGLDEELLWSLLGNSGTEQISISHLADALAGYATEEWVEGKGYLTNRDAYTKAEIDAKDWSSNKGTVTSVGIAMPTGFSVSGSPITEKGILAIGFATGYSLPTTAKQSNWDTVYNWYSGITGSDTDTIINKWGEIISFLDGIEDTATLSGIVNGINQSITSETNRAKAEEQSLSKSITDEVSRAKAAEQTLTSSISTNTSAINVLKGYFTNGVAKSAVKLQTARTIWGQSFDGSGNISGSLVLYDGPYWQTITSHRTDCGYASLGGIDSSGLYFSHTNEAQTSIGLMYLRYDGFKVNTDLTSLGTKSKYTQNSTRGQVHHKFEGADSDYGVVQIIHTSSEGSGGEGAYTASLGIHDQRVDNIVGTYEPTLFINRSGATRVPDLIGCNVGGSRLFSVYSTGAVKCTCLKTSNICIETNNDGSSIGARGSEINNYAAHLYLQHDTPNNVIMCNGGGYVGIGTSPQTKLHVAGTVRADSGIMSYNTVNVFNSTSDATYRVTIDSDGALGHIFNYNTSDNTFGALVLQYAGGNVGIGTTSVYYKLHVAGVIYSTTGIFSDGYVRADSFAKKDSSDSYVLLGGGGHSLISSLSVATATKLQTARTIWGQNFDGTSNVDGNLSCNGQGSFNSLQIGNITISYDAANKGLRIAGGGLYTDSYLSSLGVDASTALSVKKWADSINLTEESDAELATAYSIGNLYRLINSNQESITQSLNQSVGALQGRCTSLEQRVSALENKVN